MYLLKVSLETEDKFVRLFFSLVFNVLGFKDSSDM